MNPTNEETKTIRYTINEVHKNSVRRIFYCGLLDGTTLSEFKAKWHKSDRQNVVFDPPYPSDLVTYGRIAGTLDGYLKDDLKGLLAEFAIKPRLRGAILLAIASELAENPKLLFTWASEKDRAKAVITCEQNLLFKAFYRWLEVGLIEAVEAILIEV